MDTAKERSYGHKKTMQLTKDALVNDDDFDLEEAIETAALNEKKFLIKRRL